MKEKYWEHNLSPFLIEFPSNPLGLEGIRFYGMAYLCAFLASWVFLKVCSRNNRININNKLTSDLMTYIMIGVILGGRTGYVLLYGFSDFLLNPFYIFKIWEGGMASHGGLLGVLFAILIFTYKNKISFLEISDCIVSIAPFGIFLGRIANFINGELWGKITSFKWAIIFPASPLTFSELTGYYGIQPRHAYPIYASILEGLIPLIYLQLRFWKSTYTKGQLAGEFIVLYSIMRIISEIFREPDSSLIMGLSKGQFYSIILLFLGFYFLYHLRFKRKTIG